MFGQVVLAFAAVVLGCVYKAIKPPPPKVCGSPGGPPVSSRRIKLSDGRHLSYREAGVSKDEAKHKIIVVHGFAGSKDQILPVSRELVAELKLYLLFYDRAGYGESDPYPERSVKSEAYDIQELADALQLGSKLAGVSLVVPFVNFWWPGFPDYVSGKSFRMLPVQDQWTFRVARYAPWLFYWWMTQRWFPSLSLLSSEPSSVFSQQDLEIMKNMPQASQAAKAKIRQQGDYESLHRDIMVGFGRWEFDVLDLKDPFPGNEGSVHLWQGYEDKIIPFPMNRFLSKNLQWIKYHEVPDGGHMFIFEQSMCDCILRELLF
ncbi:Lipase 1, partial [Bienertia sinuspersici]